jgi:hypothetical protein
MNNLDCGKIVDDFPRRDGLGGPAAAVHIFSAAANGPACGKLRIYLKPSRNPVISVLKSLSRFRSSSTFRME